MTSRILRKAILLADSELEWVKQVSCLGHIFHADLLLDADMKRVMRSFNQQSNLLMSRFGRIYPNLRGNLHRPFCSYLYGIQIWGTEVKEKNLKELGQA